MTDHDRLDDLLTECFAELPPEDIVAGVTPWKKAMRRVLWGMGLTSVTLNFLYLQYILPTLGLVLGLLGFRAMRRENRWLSACFVLTALRLAGMVLSLVLNTTIWDWGSWEKALGIALLLSQLMNIFCLWRGLRALRQKAGLEPGAGGGLALLLWYLAVCALALVGYRGMVIGIAMIVGYGFILVSLSRLSGELDEAGYALCPAAVRIPDKVIVLALCAVLAAGMALGYAFGGQYAMDWQPLASVGQQDVAGIKAHLLELGFPDYVLEDMTAEDIALCEGALQVATIRREHPFNEGRQVVEVEGNTYHHSTVYDTRELQVTGVAVELPGERERWKLIHHFAWTEDPGFWGTECIKLIPPWRLNGWAQDSDITGRVLMEREGRTYTAPYICLEEMTYDYSNLFGSGTSTNVFAAFSFPEKSREQRGYVTFTLREMRHGTLVDSWFEYTHQQTRWLYPVQTALENALSGSWNLNGLFHRADDAIQFFADEDGVETLH